jgi:hypothetical protein
VGAGEPPAAGEQAKVRIPTRRASVKRPPGAAARRRARPHSAQYEANGYATNDSNFEREHQEAFLRDMISRSTLTSVAADQLFLRRGIFTVPGMPFAFRIADADVESSETLGELDCHGSRCFVYLG